MPCDFGLTFGALIIRHVFRSEENLLTRLCTYLYNIYVIVVPETINCRSGPCYKRKNKKAVNRRSCLPLSAPHDWSQRHEVSQISKRNVHRDGYLLNKGAKKPHGTIISASCRATDLLHRPYPPSPQNVSRKYSGMTKYPSDTEWRGGSSGGYKEGDMDQTGSRTGLGGGVGRRSVEPDLWNLRSLVFAWHSPRCVS